MRIRSIKPEFWRSPDIAALPRDMRLLFVGLWSYVDDNGVGIDDYRTIAADLFALEDDPVGARAFTRDGLARLSEAGLIVRYTVAGKPFLFIVTWDRHQRVDKPAKPRYPRPDQPGAVMTSTNTPPSDTLAETSRHSRDTLAPGTGEQRNRGTGEQGNRTDSSSPSAHAPARDDGRENTATEKPTTEAPAPPGEPKAAPRGPARSPAGTRLPTNFTVTDAMREWARTNTPTCGRTDHEAFVDHWTSQPGAKGRKLDWEATWRNWMRREHSKRTSNSRAPARHGLVERDGLQLKPETAADLERRQRFEAMDAANTQFAIGGTAA